MSNERDGIERTEAPSPRWAAQVRERGVWPSSRELVSACVVLSALLVLDRVGPTLIEYLVWQFSASLGNGAGLSNAAGLPEQRGLVWSVSSIIAPLLLIPVAVAAAVGLIQSAGRFRVELLRPNFERFMGIRVLTQVASGCTFRSAVFAAVKFFILMVFVMWLATLEVRDSRTVQGTVDAVAYCLSIPLRVMTRLALLLIGFGLIDYVWAWFCHWRQLRMTRAELATELREMEGDPINRRRMRQKQLNGSHKKWEKLLQPGDLLVLGSGRLALVIRARESGRATLIAQVVGTVADSLQRVARGRGALIVRNSELARRVVERIEIGQGLSSELVEQIARIRRPQSERTMVPS